MKEKTYRLMDGKKVTLWELVNAEPSWAASRIRVGEKAIEEVDDLRAKLEEAEKHVDIQRMAKEIIYKEVEDIISIIEGSKSPSDFMTGHKGFDMLCKYMADCESKLDAYRAQIEGADEREVALQKTINRLDRELRHEKEKTEALANTNCCLSCDNWRSFRGGNGECTRLNAITKEGFYCNYFHKTIEGEI